MKKQAALLVIISLILTACNQNKPASQIPEVEATVDSAAIAQDTFQQKNIEQSYEYAQTVMVNPKLVYDIRAYGGPASHGEYCILRRGADNKADTVVMAKRSGTIVNAFAADLNGNGKEEIYVIMRKAVKGASSYVIAFEFDNSGKVSQLSFGDSSKNFTINTPVAYDTISSNTDTIFADGKLLKKYYAHNPKYSSDMLNHAWRLQENKFTLIHND